MRLETVTGCCKARILSGFGGGHVYDPPDLCSSRLIILEKTIQIIKNAYQSGVSVIFATPTSTQKPAVEVLKELGFYHNDEGSNSILNPHHKIYPMYYCVNEYVEGMYDHLLEEIKAAKATNKKANPFK